MSTLQTLAEQRSLHLLPPPEHLPLELKAWTRRLPHISVLECYTDLAMQGFLRQSMRTAPYSLPARLALEYLNAACFSTEASRQDSTSVDTSGSCPTPEAPGAPFTKPSASIDVQDSMQSKLQSLRERLQLGCPADFLREVKL